MEERKGTPCSRIGWNPLPEQPSLPYANRLTSPLHRQLFRGPRPPGRVQPPRPPARTAQGGFALLVSGERQLAIGPAQLHQLPRHVAGVTVPPRTPCQMDVPRDFWNTVFLVTPNVASLMLPCLRGPKESPINAARIGTATQSGPLLVPFHVSCVCTEVGC